MFKMGENTVNQETLEELVDKHFEVTIIKGRSGLDNELYNVYGDYIWEVLYSIVEEEDVNLEDVNLEDYIAEDVNISFKHLVNEFYEYINYASHIDYYNSSSEIGRLYMYNIIVRDILDAIIIKEGLAERRKWVLLSELIHYQMVLLVSRLECEFGIGTDEFKKAIVKSVEVTIRIINKYKNCDSVTFEIARDVNNRYTELGNTVIELN